MRWNQISIDRSVVDFWTADKCFQEIIQRVEKKLKVNITIGNITYHNENDYTPFRWMFINGQKLRTKMIPEWGGSSNSNEYEYLYHVILDNLRDEIKMTKLCGGTF